MTENVTKKRAVPFSDAPARGWQPWGALAPLLGILFVLVPALATLRPLEMTGLADGGGDPIGTAGLVVFLFLPFGLTGALVLGWVRFVERRPLATIGLSRPGGPRLFLIGLAIGAATIFAVVAASWSVGALDPQGYGPGLASPAALGGIALLLLGFAVQASAEELLFRGWLLSAVARKFNVTTAVVLSSAVFAFLHFSPGQPLLVTVNVILFALFACCWALKAGNIWGVMGWHAGWNWLLATGFELPVTGLDAHLPALIVKLVPAGPDYLTGGPQGPEGSIFCTGFFLIGTAFAALRRVRQG